MHLQESSIRKGQSIRVSDDIVIGDQRIIMMAGPCAVENYEQTVRIAECIHRHGIRILRGGAFKPRTSPHSFQGLGVEGLEILRAVADDYNLYVITEALGVEHVPIVAKYADIIQLGSRNMQHYPLLWAVGELGKPVLLKRGFMSTIDEWLKAAEHIASRGNQNIILCERGIRTFETATRNTLDTTAISLLKQIAPHPIICDPSHATGRSELVIPAARAAIAAGADGLLIEVHPNPRHALSDSDQALPLEALSSLMQQTRNIAIAIGRDFV